MTNELKSAHIEKLKKDKLSQVEKLIYPIWGNTNRSELLKSLFNKKALTLVARINDDYIAFINCSIRKEYVEGIDVYPVAYLEGIYVEEKYRKKGLALELIKYCEAWAKKKACQFLASDCLIDNHDSILFHEKCGFKEANRLVCFTKKI